MGLLTMTFYDLLTKGKAKFPMLPVEGKFTEKFPQSYKSTPLLASYPNIQITAPGEHSISFNLDLWGPAGRDFWKFFILPAYGFQNKNYQPHPIMISWGNDSESTFTGYPLGGMASIDAAIESTGTIFSRSFDYTLTQVLNVRPRLITSAGVVLQPNTQKVTVKEGDTLLSIATKYNSTMLEISELNGGNLPFLLEFRPPREIIVPKRAK